MKKIAIVTCLKANNVCAGCACMTAFNKHTRSFAEYGDEPLELVAFMRCSHCVDDMDPLTDSGFIEKSERLKQEGTQIIHIGVCCKKDGARCPGMVKMAARFQELGMQVVWNTHGQEGI